MGLKHVSAATLIGLALLTGCATSTQSAEPQVAIAQKQERLIGYFDADGHFSQTKTSNGYSRQLLGKTADGKSVVQDFYAINGKPQTSAFVLFDDAGLEDWDSLQYTDGNIVFYNADGSLHSKAQLKNGAYTGKHQSFHLNGKVFLEETYGSDDELLEEVYFDESGKRLLSINNAPNRNGEASEVIVYDSTGKALAENDDNLEAILAVQEKIDRISYDLAVAHAKLAGQSYSDEE